ncbi:MAG: hypothetical protein ACJ78T_08815 [Myxococcales bacterium]
MSLTLADFLVKIHIIDERQHDAVLSKAKSRSGPHVLQQIIEMGIATESTLTRAIGTELSIPRIDIAAMSPEPGALHLLDARLCTERFIVPVALRENGEALLLVMADPTDQDTMALVQQRTGKKVRPAVAGPYEIRRIIEQSYTGTPQPLDEVSSIELGNEPSQVFELVNVMDESASPLSKIAAQLGVGVPKDLPSHRIPRPPVADAPPVPPPPVRLGSELFATTSGGPIAGDDLQPEDLAILDALSQSM